MMQTLQTGRLILRAWAEADLDDFYAYASNPRIGPGAGWQPHRDKQESKAILNSFIKEDETWALVWKQNGKVIGSVGLHPDRKRTGINSRMIGYVLSEEYWGRGIMVEAVQRALQHGFEDLGLEIVAVYHFPFNQRSRRVIEKCGFIYEGTIRRADKIFSGAVYDDVCYSILREEYFQMRQAQQ